MKGVILAGGIGTRLYPITAVTGKQLLPVYDKPMIYYPLSTLIHAGVNEVLIITSPTELEKFKILLKSGSQFGIKIHYHVQLNPRGVAEGVLLAKEFTGPESFWFILGDNLFHGPNFGAQLRSINLNLGALAFAYKVSNPQDYGVIEFDRTTQSIKNIFEKPVKSISSWAIPGLYRFDQHAYDLCKELKPSLRGEMEITDLLRKYLDIGALEVVKISRGNAWFDLGTSNSLLHASNFVNLVQERQGLLIGSPEEAAVYAGFIKFQDVNSNLKDLPESEYMKKLKIMLDEFNS